MSHGNCSEAPLRFGADVIVLALALLLANTPVWAVGEGWNDEHERNYALFVETLFAGEGDAAWPHLHALLRDRDRNLLFNRLGQDEDNRLTLRPDCGDLAYVLRAYFAWKHELPFHYLACTRASSPECRFGGDQSVAREELGTDDDVEAFSRFVERRVMTTVHSSSGRTRREADSERSDFYPIPIERDALRAGNVYVDPYGHALVLAGWTQQSDDESGYLLLVDAQPDGTIARRRFWRGSPLFETDSAYGGVGFKAFRPLDAQRRALSNAVLREPVRSVPLSNSQYEMTRGRFYDRVEALANPKPLDAEAALVTLVDGLEAQVNRRVAAVARGEASMRARTRPIEMPDGDIFLATGEWEAYATPVRDWRLLIAFDVVTEFPATVARNPERFRTTSRSLEKSLADELERRTIDYIGSDGQPVNLSLATLISRASALEVAYNPNDCIERRWGAAGEPCERVAPKQQREQMERLRRWFRDRNRPPF